MTGTARSAPPIGPAAGAPAVLLVAAPGPVGLDAALRRCGFDVVSVAGPEAALFAYGERDVVAVVVVIPLPGLGATALCRELRRRGRTPVLVVTAAEDVDWLEAVDAGADDHLSAPIDERILHARLRALIRRTHGPLASARITRIGDMTITWRARTVDVDPPVELTTVQSRLLERLAERPGTIVTTATLGREVASDISAAALDAQLSELRRRLADASNEPDSLQEIPGAGWRLLAVPREPDLPGA